MSTNLVIIGILISVFVLAALFYLSFAHENQSSKRSTQIAKIAEKIRRYQAFLECFPSGYLPRDVRAILVEEILFLLRAQSKLEPKTPRFNRLIEETKTLQQNIAAEKPVPPKVTNIKDIKMAKELQLRLKNLFNTLIYIGKTRKQHTNTINKYLRILQNIYVETAASVHKSTAEKAVEQGKLKLSIHHYNQVIGEYARADAKQFAPKIKELKAIIQKYDALMQQQQQEFKKKMQQSSSANKDTEKNSNGLSRMTSTDPNEAKQRY